MRVGIIENVKVLEPKKICLQVDDQPLSEEELLLQKEAEFKAKKEFYSAVKLKCLLSALADSIGRYGLTRSLVSFVDYDKMLSAAIPEFPSTETLVADRSPKNSVDVVTALENKIMEISLYISDKTKTTQEAFNSEQLIKDADAFFEEHEAVQTLQDTIDDLKALKASVEKYGLTRSLISFADNEKNLSTHITKIPSIESLTTDRSVSASADVVAAIQEKISSFLKIQ